MRKKLQLSITNSLKALCLGLFFMSGITSHAQCDTDEFLANTSHTVAGNTHSMTFEETGAGLRDEGANLGYINDTNWVMYAGMDITCANSVDFGYGTKKDNGGYIEIRMGAMPNPDDVAASVLIGQTDEVINNNNWGNQAVISAAIDASAATTSENIFLVFRSTTPGLTSLFNLHTVQFSVASLSVNHVDAIDANIYPNPTKGIVTVESNFNDTKVTVYDLNGRSLLKTTNSRVDISKYAAGMYIFKVETSNGQVVKRILKN
ncbi:T9SS type A sorting domain-containing protein [Algibacter sp. AS12]|uniref:T9SS type A sorting domain-containing protein n=1 Tax=Algibacter sp. AS12 TaxID=3135773 RepID=UPI00398B9294